MSQDFDLLAVAQHINTQFRAAITAKFGNYMAPTWQLPELPEYDAGRFDDVANNIFKDLHQHLAQARANAAQDLAAVRQNAYNATNMAGIAYYLYFLHNWQNWQDAHAAVTGTRALPAGQKYSIIQISGHNICYVDCPSGTALGRPAPKLTKQQRQRAQAKAHAARKQQ